MTYSKDWRSPAYVPRRKSAPGENEQIGMWDRQSLLPVPHSDLSFSYGLTIRPMSL